MVVLIILLVLRQLLLTLHGRGAAGFTCSLTRKPIGFPYASGDLYASLQVWPGLSFRSADRESVVGQLFASSLLVDVDVAAGHIDAAGHWVWHEVYEAGFNNLVGRWVEANELELL